MDGQQPGDVPTPNRAPSDELNHDETVSFRRVEPQPVSPSLPAPVSGAVVAQPTSAAPVTTATPVQTTTGSPAPTVDVADTDAQQDRYRQEEASYFSQQNDEAAEYGNQAELSGEEVTWTASEFVAHPKTSIWFVKLACAAVALSAVVYLATKDIITVGVIIISAIIFGVVARRQPRQLQYHVNDSGVTVDQKFYAFSSFSSFAVVEVGSFASIDLMPLKRFAPMISIHCDPEQENKIIEIMARHLPVDQNHHSAVDGFMHRIRF